jgi:hypothetical protein
MSRDSSKLCAIQAAAASSDETMIATAALEAGRSLEATDHCDGIGTSLADKKLGCRSC